MRSLLLLSLATLVTSLMLISCNNKDEGTKDVEISQDKQAYDRCVAVKGQAYCNSAKAGTLASMTEFYGQSAYYNFYGANNYLAMNPNAVVYTQDQLNAYFENYLKTNSKSDILLMSNRWYQMSTEINPVVNPLLYNNNNLYGRRCTVYGCY
jgi:hypothetical protein